MSRSYLWYEELPYGPLTDEDFKSLSISFYDGSRLREQQIAALRGIEPGDYLRMKLAENMARRATATEVNIQEIPEDPLSPVA
jgi:hypothetical protein